MSNNKMLIDATHPEETRVVVLRDGRVEEFDYESVARKLLRGNIYLAKVTRVEPSLQASFIDYGGNRHGFLAFSEIHPDYYQIPMADRQVLLEEEAAAEAAEEAAADAQAERLALRNAHKEGQFQSYAYTDTDPNLYEEKEENLETRQDEEPSTGREGQDYTLSPDEGSSSEIQITESRLDYDAQSPPSETDTDSGDLENEDQLSAIPPQETDAPNAVGLVENQTVEVISGTSSEPETVEQSGGEDALEELPSRPRRRRRSYKIQEVIKRRQIILVQVVKEERGNKGAALTTYLSLAGRYTVLMPNTARGGGISRKISNPQDRKRLKAIAAELDVPEGMGLIIRTAGAARTKQEIKRDYEYLLRLWENVRDLTLKSTAPCLVYEEGNLIKRSIRDLYNKDVDEIIVAGENAHEEAKNFMSMLMPSHAKNVLLHTSSEPLFNKFGIERQLNAMFSPYVNLRSGGYIVINQTEALVAIDVNSGRSTREFSIEETAFNTNLEAADEIARQLKLRDLAGLIVIDFIDMEQNRNNRAVERRLKDALRFDRARIQLGRISPFGLMEMSRQRLRSGVLEGSTSQCPHCQGTGIIRSTESVALAVLRTIEDTLITTPSLSLVANTSAQVALYILNNKRSFIADLENRYGVSISILASDKIHGSNFAIEKGPLKTDTVRRSDRSAVNMDWGFNEAEESEESIDAQDEAALSPSLSELSPEGGEKIDDQGVSEDYGYDKRFRRGRRGRWQGRRSSSRHYEHSEGSQRSRGYDTPADSQLEQNKPLESFGASDYVSPEQNDTIEGDVPSNDPGTKTFSEEDNSRFRRRGRRGGRRGRGRFRDNAAAEPNENASPEDYQPHTHINEQYVDDFSGEISERGNYGNNKEEFTGENIDMPIHSTSKKTVLAETELSHSKEETLPNQEIRSSKQPTDGPREVRKRHKEPISSEPRIERVVLKTDQENSSTDTVERPLRRGWWQRRPGEDQ